MKQLIIFNRVVLPAAFIALAIYALLVGQLWATVAALLIAVLFALFGGG